MRNNAWLFLILAGIFEIAWAIGLKYTQGWTKPVPSIFTGIALVASFFLLSAAIKSLPIGTAYAVWTGIGIVGATSLGIILFKEPATFGRLFFIFLILTGIVGLKFSTQD
jgi:quaternary ammonium compound-resistance protein SugE